MPAIGPRHQPLKALRNREQFRNTLRHKTLVECSWPHFDRKERVACYRILGLTRRATLRACLKMERGCVEDQPQHGEHSKAPIFWNLLRLVEDDTAALRGFQTGSYGMSALIHGGSVERRTRGVKREAETMCYASLRGAVSSRVVGRICGRLDSGLSQGVTRRRGNEQIETNGAGTCTRFPWVWPASHSFVAGPAASVGTPCPGPKVRT